VAPSSCALHPSAREPKIEKKAKKGESERQEGRTASAVQSVAPYLFFFDVNCEEKQKKRAPLEEKMTHACQRKHKHKKEKNS
jgi:hypothetical protein